MFKNNQLDVESEKPIAERKSYFPYILPDKTEQRGKNAGEVLSISDEIKNNPNNIGLMAKYIQKEFECRDSEELRDETEYFLKKGEELMAAADTALSLIKNPTALHEQPNSLKQIIKELKQGIQLLGFKIACGCKELKRTALGLEENIQTEVDNILKENDRIITEVNLFLKSEDPVTATSTSVQNQSFQKLISDFKNSIQLTIARIYGNYQKLQVNTEEPRENKSIPTANNSNNKAEKETGTKDRVEELQEQIGNEKITMQDMGIALQKGKPELFGSVFPDIDQSLKNIKSRMKELGKLSSEFEQKQIKLESPYTEPLILVGSAKPDEWNEISSQAKEIWDHYCKENERKYLESSEGNLVHLQRKVISCFKTIKEKETKVLKIAEEIEEKEKAIITKENQLSSIIDKLELDFVKEWHEIEKLCDCLAPAPNFKKLIKNCIVAECKKLCWPDKDDYRDKYAIVLSQKLENHFKINKDVLKISNDQIFEFLSGFRFFVLNSSNVSLTVDIALEIDELEMASAELEEDLKLQEKLVLNNRREISEAEKSIDRDILRSDNNIAINQNTIRKKLKEYLDINDKSIDLIERFDAIYCEGFSFLWLYAKFLSINTAQDENDYCSWFQSTIRLIKNWDTERELEKQEVSDFNKLILLIWHFKHINNVNKNTTKKIIQDVVAEIAKEKFRVEYSITSLFTLTQLKQLLGLENFIQNNKLVLVTSYNSTTAVFKTKENYYYFDPNSNFEEVQVASNDVLAKLIFNAHFYVATKPSPFGFRILSSEKDPKAEYPSQKYILDTINPAIVIAEKRYAYETVGLILAANIGDLESVKYFLNKQIDPNIKNTNDYTSFMFAADHGYLEIIKVLLENKVAPDINVKNKSGCTALMCATGKGHIEIAKELLTNPNIDLNIQSKEKGYTALIEASKRDDADTVKLLLTKQNIDLDVQDNKGYTALMHASEKGCIDVVKVLLTKKEIDPNLQEDINRLTALMLAIDNKHFEVARLLLTHPNTDPNIQNYVGDTALIKATQKGCVETVKALLTHPSINVNLKGHVGWTALINAIVLNQTAVIKTLLEHPNINPNTYTESGSAPLIKAAEDDYWDAVKLLLAHPCTDPNIQGDFGCTALMNAVREGRLEIVKELLSHPKIDPNLQGYLGCTPLNKAITEKHLEIVKELLKHLKIDPNIQDTSDNTALMNATHQKQVEIVKELLKHPKIDPNIQDASGDTALMNATYQKQIDIVKELLKHKNLDANVRNKRGSTALMWPIYYNDIEIIKTLLECSNIDPNAENILIWATEEGNIDIVKLLLKHPNIDPNIKGFLGDTALIEAAKKGFVELVNELLNHPKINPNIQDNSGNTALIEAAEEKHLNIIASLLKHPDINPNTKGFLGKTALIEATTEGNVDMINILLNHPKIDPNIQDNIGDTALMKAAYWNNIDIIKIFLGYGSVNVNEVFLWAAEKGYTDIINKILARLDVAPNVKGRYGYTVLTIAVIHHNVEAVKLLLSHPRVNHNITDNKDQTAFEIAIACKNLDIVKEFTKYPKVDFNIKTKDGKTIFEIDTSEEIKQFLQKYKYRD